ncbi:translation initiation factor IF-2 [Candidatus Parcubacteria bacterium]|nr:translation initiation factor IF-2 [Candidatus Parcubacteria bacterium]
MEKKTKENLINRPPVVVIMGHVDHGKSSILEAIKDFKITTKESGGITQHIGAYEIEHQGKKITFLDTPGHEAFSAMRSRGAKVADIAILVVAAEEGIKPQTKEAISYIKQAGIPMIVAINKVDKPAANPEMVKTQLAEKDVLVESMGGKVPSINVSAKDGKGIQDIVELILLVAEMEDIKAGLDKPAEGVIIEAYLNSQKGLTATLLLTDGVLQKEDSLATHSAFGKIRSLENWQGDSIEKAFPSAPVVVLGFDSAPQVGERFKVCSNISAAQDYVAIKSRKEEKREMFFAEEGKQVLNLILKADVSGSVEAVEEIIKKLPQEKVILRILKKDIGEINENDVHLAKSAKAKILGFRVKTNPIAAILAKKEKIKIVNFEIIYELVQSLRQIMEKILKAEVVRKDMGKMKTLLVFRTEKRRQIVGGKIIEGEIRKGFLIEIFRDDEKIGEGKVVNLQKNKKNIEVATKGDEAGILYEGNTKVEEGDIIVFYTKEKVKAEL